jgi:hypothetical protein
MAKISNKAFSEAAAMNDEFDALMLDMASAESVTEDNVIEALEEASASETIADVINSEFIGEVIEPQSKTAQDFDARLAAVTDEQAIAKAIEIGKQIDQRVEFERAKGNETIQKHLNKSRKQLATPSAARVVIACNVDIAEINRSVHEGVCYNVYALGKLADAIQALSGGVLGNAINNACMRSLFQFRAAGQVFNGEMAKAAASDKIRVEVGLRGMLVRHTVSASTASTQASSTMQALTTLGIVKRSGSQKNPVFDLTDTDIVAKLSEVVAKAA